MVYSQGYLISDIVNQKEETENWRSQIGISKSI